MSANRGRARHVARCRSDRRSPPHAAQAHLLARRVAVLVAIAAVVGARRDVSRRSDVLTRGRRLHRAREDHRPDPQRPGARRSARAARANRRAKAVIVHIDSPGGTTAGSEQLYDVAAARRGRRSRWSSWSTGSRPRAATSPRCRRPHRRAGHLAGRLDRRAVPVSERHRAAEDDRRQGRGDQILAAQGRAERLRADQPGGARRDRGDRHGFLCLVPRPGAGPPQARRRGAASASPTAACSPAGRRSSSSWSTSSATRGPRSPGSPRKRGIDGRDAGARLCSCKPRFGDLSFLHVAAAIVLDAVGLGRARAAHRGLGRGAGDRAAQS